MIDSRPVPKQIIRRTVPESPLPDSLHPVLRRIYAARGVACTEQLDYSLNRLHPCGTLAGIDPAVELLAEAITQRRRVLVVGDFDADGATGCALALRGLRAMGAVHVDYVVPNRFEYGYGLSPEIVAVAARREPDLLITVDNGTSSHEGVAVAKRMGMRVLITDHHLPGAELPAADAIVNPHQPGDQFPGKNLAGVGVMFYVLTALRAKLRERGWFARSGIAEPKLAALLDLVALGTVADVVPLDHTNRILVSQGLARIRAGQCSPGIRALMAVAGRTPARLTASDLGFALGPRLNAAGRLRDMSLGIECLLCDQPQAAMDLAGKLDELNRQRREIEASMHEQALGALEALALEGETDLPHGLCLFDESWHQGVVGILAARVRERTHRPVIAFAASGADEIKGSARSVPGVHVRDVLATVASTRPGLVTKFGGHAMAAGITLKRADLDPFRRAFDAELRKLISSAELRGVLYTDGELEPSDLRLELAEALRQAGPWGQGFAEPLFDGRFEILDRRCVADKHLRIRVRPAAGSESLEAIAFNTDAREWPEARRTVNMVYRLEVNVYQGLRSPQLVVEHAVAER